MTRNLISEEHLDPSSEITLDTVKERAVKGVAVLTGRTLVLSVVSLVATFFLTIFLEPSEFGVFWIVSAIINFLAYFSDVGLAAALIQKKDKVTSAELKTTFTIQQILVLFLLVLIFGLTPFIVRFYSLPHEGIFLLYSLGISFLLSSLKTIPSVLLERQLDFTKLVIPQVLENLVYNVLVVILAWSGFGLASFAYSVLARGIVGLVAIYVIKPWIPKIGINRDSLRSLLSFGLPYQANTFLATIKDDGMTAFLGGILGASGIGFLGWAQKWAYTPLRLFMDHVLKVTFPAFARMQDNKEELSRSVTRSIFFVCFLVFPATVVLVTLAPVLIQIIPRYTKWEPALIPLYLISINTFFGAATTQLTNIFNAVGKIKVTFKLMIMWTVLTWVLVPILAIKYGVNGAALGYAVVSSSSLVAIYIARKIVKFDLSFAVGKPFLGSVILAFVLLGLRSLLPNTMATVWILCGLGVVVYFGSMYFIVGSSLLLDAKKGIRSAFTRN